MTTQLIAVDASALDRVLNRLDDLERKLDAVQMTPAPTWLTIAEYAQRVGKSEATVRRWICKGEIECKHEGKTRMVRVSPAA